MEVSGWLYIWLWKYSFRSSILRLKTTHCHKSLWYFHIHSFLFRCQHIIQGHSQIPLPIPVDAGSVAPRLLGLRIWIPRRYWCLSLGNVVCCQLVVSASGWSLVQNSPTECTVCNCVWSWILENEESPVHSGLFSYGKIKDQVTLCVLVLIIETYTRLSLSVLSVTTTELRLEEGRHSLAMLHRRQLQMLKIASPIGQMKHRLNSLFWQASNCRFSRTQGSGLLPDFGSGGQNRPHLQWHKLRHTSSSANILDII